MRSKLGVALSSHEFLKCFYVDAKKNQSGSVKKGVEYQQETNNIKLNFG